MNIRSYVGKKIRVTCKDKEIFQGNARVHFDEDDTDEYIFLFPKEGCLIEVHEKDIKKIEILSD